ncbi:MAG: class I SAM-dependent methyltransferase [Hamadaea sp.]|nr:class I SAM-dependent methyltransferase [Hamadaea sp.]
MPIDPALGGVPETALWTLHHRAREAARPDTVLPDPMALRLVAALDYPFEQRFGHGFPAQAQTLALRARAFDDEIRAFLDRRPDGTVVALGEGFETTFWRVDNGRVHWLTVDLPETAALRRELLPHGDRQRVVAGSAFDLSWADSVDPARGVLVTAQGLLMYFPPAQSEALLAGVAARFPGGGMVFDTITSFVNRQVLRQLRGGGNFLPPPLQWFVDPGDLQRLRDLDPAIATVREVRPRAGRGLAGWLAPRLRYVPYVGRRRPCVVALTFAGTPDA